MLEQERQFLAEACAEIRRLRRAVPSTDRYHTFRGTSFGGIPAAQYWADFVVWETILNDNPDMNGIIEIGTWQGGFSFFLDAQARARGMRFYTYDAVVPEREIPQFRRLDVWAHPETVEYDIQSIGEPLLLFCDGGNKPRELATFSKLLSDPKSLILAHDWGTETLPTDVPEWLTPVYESFCDDLGAITRIFRVKDGT